MGFKQRPAVAPHRELPDWGIVGREDRRRVTRFLSFDSSEDVEMRGLELGEVPRPGEC